MHGSYLLIILPATIAVVSGALLLAPRRRARGVRMVIIPAPPHPTALALALNDRDTSSRPGEQPGPLSEPSGATGAGPAQHPADGPERPGAALALPAAHDGTPESLYGALRAAEGWEPGRFEGRSTIGPAGYMLALGAVFDGITTTGPPRCTYPYPDSCTDLRCPEHGLPDDAPFTLIRRVSYLDHKLIDPELDGEMAVLDHKPAADRPWNTVYPCEYCARHTPNGPQCGACNLMTCADCLRCPYQDDHDDQAYTRRATAGELAAYRTAGDTWAADLETSIRGWHLEHGHTRMPWESTSFPAVNG